MADRRQVPRYFFNGEAHFTDASDGQTSTFELHILSVMGCRGTGTSLPPVGHKGDLRIRWEGKEFQAESEVMWKNAKNAVGLKFLTIEDAHLRLLRNILSGLQVQPLGTLPKEPDKVRY